MDFKVPVYCVYSTYFCGNVIWYMLIRVLILYFQKSNHELGRIFTHQEHSSPKGDVTCADHARFTLRARVNKCNTSQVSSVLHSPSTKTHLLPESSTKPSSYMEAAILIICYLAGFVFVLFGLYQLAGLLDKLACQEPNIKVWFLKKLLQPQWISSTQSKSWYPYWLSFCAF